MVKEFKTTNISVCHFNSNPLDDKALRFVLQKLMNPQ